MVVRPGRIMADASPGRTFVPSLRHAYSPVRREYREGVLVADVQWVFVNRKPRLASLSIFGVLRLVAP
jgi:hypothetical protein